MSAFLKGTPTLGKVLKGGAGFVAKAPPRVGNVIKWGALGTGAFVGADAVVAPGIERATGIDIPWLGGTLTQEAVAGSARSIGTVITGAQASYIRGAAEGGLRGLLPELGEGESRQFVTIALLGIGGLALFSVLKK